MTPAQRVTLADLVSERISMDTSQYEGYLAVATMVVNDARRYLFEQEWQVKAAVERFTAAGSINDVIEAINSFLAQLPDEIAARSRVIAQDYELPYDDQSKRLIKLDS